MSPQHYEISGPARHAAVTILRNFQLTSLDAGMEATLENVATLIDVATQSFRVYAALKALSKAARWWDQPDLENNLDRLQDAVRAVELVLDRMPRFRAGAETPDDIKDYPEYDTSAPALHAAKVLFQNFMISSRPESPVILTERNLAILIDVCTEIFRVEMAANYLVHRIPWANRSEARGNILALRKALRAVELVKNRMPDYREPLQIPIKRKQELEIKLTRAQLERAQLIAKEVSSARSADEQQRILAKAGIVAYR